MPVPPHYRGMMLWYAEWHAPAFVALLVAIAVCNTLYRTCIHCVKLGPRPAIRLLSLKCFACGTAKYQACALNTADLVACSMRKSFAVLVQRAAVLLCTACHCCSVRCGQMVRLVHRVGVVKTLGQWCSRALEGKRTQGVASATSGLPTASKCGSSQSHSHEDHSDCVVCFDAPRSVALIPCGHVVLCGGCFANLQKQARHSKCGGLPCCPVCRTEVKKHVGGLIVS